MANWVECKLFGGTGEVIFVNLDMVVSVSGNDKATVVKYPGGDTAEFVIQGPPHALLANQGLR